MVSAALFLTYSGTNTTRDYKVIITISIQVTLHYLMENGIFFCIFQDVYNQESHSQSSCVYYLTREREGPPDGATPSYKVKH